jgi:hypothetical protein
MTEVSTMSDNYGPPPVRVPEHERLGMFVGKWHAEGESYGGQRQNRAYPRQHAEPWSSDETTVWHPGRFFLVQHEEARVGSGSLITHAVLGYDPQRGEYFAHAVENHGYYRKYDVRVAGRVWTFQSQTERCRIEFSEDGTMQTVVWEWRPVDNEWLPLCERTNIRVEAAR